MRDYSVQSVLDFWLTAGPDRWFEKNARFDVEVSRQLLAAHEAAAAGKLDAWADHADGVLALLILLDQAPRNMFRGTARAFATDAKALALAEKAVGAGFDCSRDGDVRQFFHMPFMHAEDLAAQARCIELCRASGDEVALEYALIHHDVIARFGRFPHRNAALGRTTTDAEQAFLDAGGFSA